MSSTEGTSRRSDSATGPAGATGNGSGGGARNGSRRNGGAGGLSPGASTAARLGAAGAVIAAIVVVLVLILGSGSSYTVHADFQDASGLVNGDNVLIGPAAVGTVSSISLARDGRARVKLTLHGTGTLHRGTVARIYEDSLSGIASKYVELEPGPRSAAAIDSGGTIDAGHTRSEVNIDELFNSFDAKTRTGLRNLVRGEADSLRGKGALANRTLKYLAPGLQSTGDVTRELARDEPAFDGLLVQGAAAMRTLASRSTQLTQLISNSSAAAGAIAGRSQALQDSLQLLPGTLRRSTSTFAGLNSTLDSLDPVVAAAKPNSRRLPQFATALGAFAEDSAPTVAKLNRLITNPTGGGDLTTLARATPGLAAAAARAYPALVHDFTESRPQLDYLREYTPDVVAALANVGQAGSYYDANGHYVRTQALNYMFAVDSSNQLVDKNPADRYDGLTHVTSRCPGSAVQANPDGSSPRATSGCSTSSVPPGP